MSSKKLSSIKKKKNIQTNVLQKYFTSSKSNIDPTNSTSTSHSYSFKQNKNLATKAQKSRGKKFETPQKNTLLKYISPVKMESNNEELTPNFMCKIETGTDEEKSESSSFCSQIPKKRLFGTNLSDNMHDESVDSIKIKSQESTHSISSQESNGKNSNNEEEAKLVSFAYQIRLYEYFDNHHLRLGLIKPFSNFNNHKPERFKDNLIYSLRDLLNQSFCKRAFDLIKINSTKFYPNEDIFIEIINIFMKTQDDILKIEAINLLKKLISDFSINESFMIDVYLKLFQLTPQLKDSESNDKNLILYLLYHLEDELAKTKKKFRNFQKEYYHQDMKKEHFSNLSLSERIDRLQILLDILVNILESEFLFWLHHDYSNSTPNQNVPLVIRYFYPDCVDNKFILNTNTLTRLLNRLLRCTYKNSSINFIQRLISIIGEYISLPVLKSNSPIKYPFFGNDLQIFCKEIYDMLADLDSKEFLKAIQLFKQSWIKMYLVNYKLSYFFKINFGPAKTLEFGINSLKNFKNSSNNMKKSINSENIQMNLKINKKDAKGETQLHISSRSNNCDEVNHLLSIEGINVNANDNYNWTPLHEACNHGNFQVVQLLLNYQPSEKDLYHGLSEKVNVNSRSLEGVTPLMDAASNNHYDVCLLLLEHSGSYLLRTSDERGQTAFDYTSDERILKMFKEFLSKDPYSSEPLKDIDEYTAIKNLTEFLFICFIDTYQMRETHVLLDYLRENHPKDLKINRRNKVTLNIDMNDYAVLFNIMENMKQFILKSKSFHLLPYCF